eukprot:scpid91575/ scgid8424/ 
MEGLPMVRTAALDELGEYHEQLMEKYKNVRPEDIKQTPDAMKLVAFNGYYSMDVVKGAFFTVDTNIHLKKESTTPIYDLALIVCMDGTTSNRVPFTGTFDGVKLKQNVGLPSQVQIDLTFVRGGGSDGTTASFSGKITFPSQMPVTVTGSTYNNPIGCDLYIGEYYEKQELQLVAVMQIGPNYQLKYDFGSNDGQMEDVPEFTYNMNMFFFTFSQANDRVSLIMGTAAAKGLTCNNMITNVKAKELVKTRLLWTIPSPTVYKPPRSRPSLKTIAQSAKLETFSGYYRIASIAQGAFISIQAEYACTAGASDGYSVAISYSLDGKSASGYTFDAGTMIFENNTLTMPQQVITLTFGRVYTSGDRGLVSLAGSIPGYPNITATGSTPFNPVPLSAFGGVPMTISDRQSSLTIVSDNEVQYNGTTVKDFLYVPLMHILYSDKSTPEFLLALGTDGRSGNTCIVTNNPTKSNAAVSVLSAVHPPVNE